jgi:ATP-dependent RNA helicase DDX52/ROK1
LEEEKEENKIQEEFPEKEDEKEGQDDSKNIKKSKKKTKKKKIKMQDRKVKELKVLDLFEHIVLDEADKYFEYSYMDQLQTLLSIFNSAHKHYMLFSATLPGAIERAIEGIFANKIKCIIGGRVNVLSSIEQRLIFCQTEEGKTIEMANIINEGLQVPCLIFVQNKERVRQLNR